MNSDQPSEPYNSYKNKHNANLKALWFRYELVSKGKVSGEFGYENSTIQFALDNSSNPLNELLKGMINLVYEPSHIWGEENCSIVDWYTETGCLRWKISTSNGYDLQFGLIHFSDIFDESSGKELFEESVLMTDFYFAIVQELDLFIKRLGLLNYEQQWQGDEFPLTYFLVLKKYLIEKGSWIPSAEKVGSLNDEIDFLMA